MKVTRQHLEVSEVWIAQVRSGNEQALRRLHATLKQRFLPLALSFLKDEHEAQDAINDAFMKLQARLDDGFIYQGSGRFYAYFETILKNACRDHYREDKPRRDWEKEHLLPSAPADEDGEDKPEYVECAVGYDPRIEQTEMRRNHQLREELKQHLEIHLTPQDQRFWEAYQALTEMPGSHEWGDHEKTAFLKKYLGLPKSTFYPAHTRFKQRLEHVARRFGLVR